MSSSVHARQACPAHTLAETKAADAAVHRRIGRAATDEPAPREEAICVITLNESPCMRRAALISVKADPLGVGMLT